MPRISRRVIRERTQFTDKHRKALEGHDFFGAFGSAGERNRNTPEYVANRRAAWEAMRDEIMHDWIIDKPGTRPAPWWDFDCPEGEYRRCINGVHPFECEARRAHIAQHMPGSSAWDACHQLHFGRPNSLIPYRKGDGDDFGKRYETQFAFLDRHGLIGFEERAAYIANPTPDLHT